MISSTNGSAVCSSFLGDLETSSVVSSIGSSCHPYLKSKIQIGSVKGPTNFGCSQTVFHRDDVPTSRRERKKEVKEWKEDRKILSTMRGKSPGWCSSVSLDPSRLKEPRTKSNSEHDPAKPYQYNYRAESLPPKAPDPMQQRRPNNMFEVSCVTEAEAERRRVRRREYPDNALEHPKRVAEMPTNRALDCKPTWNSSTELDASKKRQAIMEEYAASCKLANSRRNGQLRAYTAPEQREKERWHRIRQLKREGRLWTLREPEVEPTLWQTHNRLAKDPIRRVRQYRHSGKWEFHELEGCMMWSDTASCDHDSPGDVIKVHNPRGFNFSAPCLTRVVAWGSN